MKICRSDGSLFRLFTTISVLALCASIPFSVSVADDKPRVAIKEPRVGEGVKDWSRKHLNISTLLAEMEASLQHTRKFQVLSRKREVLKEVREEQQAAQTDLFKGNTAREGELENADYLLIPTVQDFSFYRSTKQVPNIRNKYFRTDSGRLEVNAQVIDTSTGGIKATFYMKSSFSTKRKIVNAKGGSPSSVYFTTMAKKVGAQMSDQLVDTVFPMRILSSKGNKVWINRGQDGGLKVGDILKVYRPGEELIDPDTGEILGSAEELIGEIKVVRVNPKFTIAELTKDALLGVVEKGDIARKP